MKKKKESRRLSREELAQEITRLAGRIADGALSLEKGQILIPEELLLEWSVGEKHGKFALNLSVKGSYEHRDSRPSLGKRSPRSRRPYEAKRLKKALAGHWKEIKRSIRRKQQIPEREKCLALLDKYGNLADPSWKQAWETCKERITMLLELTERGDFEAAAILSEEIEGLIKSCHKAYK